ncbi:hypothetical protein BH11MYX1_BH11MYX1_30320 [soil metagenome]
MNQAQELVRLALKALDDLRALDESLYERFVASRDAPSEPAEAARGLQQLWEMTFSGLAALLGFCKSLGAGTQAEPDAPAEEFDFADFGESKAAPKQEDDLALGATDLLDFLDQIDEQTDNADQGDHEKWNKVVERVVSIEYGLTSQQADAKDRLKVALSTGEIGHALGVLDDTQSSASEGVHALVGAVYETFTPDVNPTTVVPGYLTALGRALLVRRGVAELAANLGPYNEVLQGDDPTRYEAALAAVRTIVHGYVMSVVCRAMRPADRWQMVEFERLVRTQQTSTARLTTEGLVKYLDSLGTINQREVLVMHDRRTVEAMREAVSNARQLVDLSPRAAVEMMDRAYQAAQRLKGRSTAIDKLVAELEQYAPQAAEAAPAKFLDGLEGVLAIAGG